MEHFKCPINNKSFKFRNVITTFWLTKLAAGISDGTFYPRMILLNNNSAESFTTSVRVDERWRGFRKMGKVRWLF